MAVAEFQRYFVKWFSILAILVLQHKSVFGGSNSLYESKPQEVATLDFRSSTETFSMFSDEEASGKFSISISLLSFICPVTNGSDPSPFLEIQVVKNGPIVGRWECGNREATNNWEALESIHVSNWASISYPSSWKVDWSARVVGTLYQNEYASSGSCAQGYFDCALSSEKCPPLLGTTTKTFVGPTQCIDRKLVCNKYPNCGMACSSDEGDCRDDNGGDDDDDDDDKLSIWIYIGPGVGVGIILVTIIIVKCCHQKNQPIVGLVHTLPPENRPQAKEGELIGALVIPIVAGPSSPSAPPENNLDHRGEGTTPSSRPPMYPPSYEESIRAQ